MSIILGIAGRKQSGKNTLANSIIGSKVAELGLVDYIRVGVGGQIIVPTDKRGKNDETIEGILDFDEPSIWKHLNERCMEVHKVPFAAHLSLYSFADPLKQFCMEVFGLTQEQCYGTDKEKNSKSEIQLGNLQDLVCQYDDHFEFSGVNLSDKLSAREVLQIFGTDICRTLKESCWVNATISRIKEEGAACSIVTDVRFPNEANGIHDAGGKVVYLTRNVCEDRHKSETALDNYKGFDGIIDNHEMSLEESLHAFHNLLASWGWAT